jgi:hypothetical protein
MKIVRNPNNSNSKDDQCYKNIALKKEVMQRNFLTPMFEHRNYNYMTYDFDYQSIFSLVAGKKVPRSPSDCYKLRPLTSDDVPHFLQLAFLDTAIDLNYGHCLHDILPALFSLDTDSRFDQIIARCTPLMSSLIKLFGLNFKKISFIEPEQALSVNCINLYKFKLFRNYHHQRNYKISMDFKNYLDSYINKSFNIASNNRLIYCSRNHSSDVKHGRRMDDDNELKIVDMLKDFSTVNGFDFTLFTGQEDGQTMSHEKQLLLFREAKIVIGPHGSAMANVIYLNPDNQPKVCEFSSGPEIFPIIKHGTEPFGKNYNHLNAFIFDELYDYSLISFTEESTPESTIIDLRDLETFLDTI